MHGRAKYGTRGGTGRRGPTPGAHSARDRPAGCTPSTRVGAGRFFVFPALRAGTNWCGGSGRGTESAEERRARLSTARVELASVTEFDATIVNDDVQRAAEELVSWMRSTPTESSVDACPEPRPTPSASPTRRSTNSSRRPTKYALVLYSAKRARQINAYYSQLQEGLLEYVGPLVESEMHEKPLSISLREINNDLLTIEPIEE